MTIEWIHQQAQGDYDISAHAYEECLDEDISLTEVRQALQNGEMLEHYAARKDIRGESCLVLGWGENKRPIHIVVSQLPNGDMRVITAYLPRPPKWTDERKRG